MRRLLCLVPYALVCALGIGVAHAQQPQRTITGQVREAGTREPVAGALVLVKDTAISTTTDADGSYKLTGVPMRPVTIVITTSVHKDAEVQVPLDGDVANADLELAQSEEILVVGRAPRISRQNLANGASVVRAEELTQVTSQTVDDALQGKIAGANIQANSGAPGGGIQIKLRGVSTINGNAQPLYVIDGVVVSDVAIPSGLSAVTKSSGGSNASSTQDNQVNRIADLNPNDIESIEVLKGASAAALYGSKASNGVIIITTKRGRQGDVRINFTQRVGFYQIANTLGTRTFETADEAVEAFGEAARFHFDQGRTFDHEREILGPTTPAYETALSLSGGNDRTTYFGSVLAREDPGIIDNTFYQKQSARVAVSHDIDRKVKIGITTNLIHSTASRGITNNDNTGTSHYLTFPSTPNFIDLRPFADGTFPENPFIGSRNNPLQTVALASDREDVWRLISALNGNWNVWSDQQNAVTLTANVGVDRFQQRNDLLFPPDLHFEQNLDEFVGTALDSTNENLNVNAGVNGIYSFYPRSGKWRSVSSAGYQYEMRELDGVYIVAEGLIAGLPNADNATNVTVSEVRQKVEDQGVYAQEEVLLLDERLSLLAAVRGEASSVNGDTGKLFLYPKAATTYRVPGVEDFFDLLRVRLAFGQAGNQPQYGQKFNPLSADDVIEGQPGVGIVGLKGDPNIQPERQTEIEGGVDLVALNGRVVSELTFYNKTISDLILARTPAPSTGIATELFNGGKLRNQGVEFMVQATPIKIKDLSWLSRIVFSLNRSKVLELPVEAFLTGGFGTALGAFQIEEGASATQIVGDAPQDDGSVEVVRLGDAEPTFRVSFVENVTFGDFELTSLWDWQQGSEIINLTKLLYDFGANTADFDELVDDGEGNMVLKGEQRLGAWLAGDASQYIESGTFLKLRELSVAYNVPKRMLGLVGGVDRARVSVSARNLLTLTGYTGLDPEVSNFGNQPIARNIDVGPYPPNRSFWLSIEAGF